MRFGWDGHSRAVKLLRAIGFLIALLSFLAGREANAQLCANPPCPLPEATGFANVASSSAAQDRITNFLDFQSRRFAAGRREISLTPAGRVALAYDNVASDARGGPFDAYAKASTGDAHAAVQRYRGWLEGYGSTARNDAQNAFTGDYRRTFGGIAGIGAAITPDVNIGFSVDQARTDVDVTAQPQHSKMDVTQLGLLLSANSGPWTFGVAGVYGFGRTRSSRLDAIGESTASYGMDMYGVIGEASYYWSSQGFRLVPKAGVDWTRVKVDPYSEVGGGVPVAASGQITERTRVYGALEVGYRKDAGAQVYDVSVYGKFIEIVSQDVGDLVVSPTAAAPGFVPGVIPGLVDARFEFATGAAFNVRLSSVMQLYANYNGRFRHGYDSHAGTLGMEVRW
jgi:uncharacterized protein with beta-barrel porin domain